MTDQPTSPIPPQPPDVWGLWSDELGVWNGFQEDQYFPEPLKNHCRLVRLVPAGSEVVALVEAMNWHTASAYRMNEDRMKYAIDAINELTTKGG